MINTRNSIHSRLAHVYARLVVWESRLGTWYVKRAHLWTGRDEIALPITSRMAVMGVTLRSRLAPSRTGVQLARELVCCHHDDRCKTGLEVSSQCQ